MANINEILANLIGQAAKGTASLGGDPVASGPVGSGNISSQYIDQLMSLISKSPSPSGVGGEIAKSNPNMLNSSPGQMQIGGEIGKKVSNKIANAISDFLIPHSIDTVRQVGPQKGLELINNMIGTPQAMAQDVTASQTTQLPIAQQVQANAQAAPTESLAQAPSAPQAAPVTPQNLTQTGNRLTGMDILKGILPILNMPEMVKTSLEIQKGKTPQGQLQQKINEANLVPPTQAELLTAKTTKAKEDKERSDNFFKQINEPLATSKELSQVEGAITGLDDMTNLLQISTDQNGNVQIGNKALLSDKNFLGKNRQELKRARDVFINKSLRRDSGAAIGKEEEKQFKDTFGFDIGLSSFMQNPEVIAKSLVQSKEQLLRDRNRLSPNEEVRSLVTGLRQQGFKDPEIFEYMKRSGRV